MGQRPWARAEGQEAEGRGLRAEYDDVACGHFSCNPRKSSCFVDDRFRRLPMAYLTSGVVKCWIYMRYMLIYYCSKNKSS